VRFVDVTRLRSLMLDEGERYEHLAFINSVEGLSIRVGGQSDDNQIDVDALRYWAYRGVRGTRAELWPQ